MEEKTEVSFKDFLRKHGWTFVVGGTLIGVGILSSISGRKKLRSDLDYWTKEFKRRDDLAGDIMIVWDGAKIMSNYWPAVTEKAIELVKEAEEMASQNPDCRYFMGHTRLRLQK